jgi:hypothetical protein
VSRLGPPWRSPPWVVPPVITQGLPDQEDFPAHRTGDVP